MENSEITYLIIAGTAILVLLSMFVIALLWNYYKRNASYRNKLIHIEHQKQQALLQTQLEIQEQTLRTISEEIHDNVGQVLSLAKLNLNTVGQISDPQVLSKIDSTKELVSKAINDLRDLSRSLHGEKIGEIGLQGAVANELKILQNTGQFETEMQVSGTVYKLDPQKEMVLFRIVQEALHNAVKHASASKLKVSMKYDPAHFTLAIQDNGPGFEPRSLARSKTGIGLKNMQNRATLIGGEFTIESSAEQGTSICIALPNGKN
jgi:two-component system, NarL family, sensor kinase